MTARFRGPETGRPPFGHASAKEMQLELRAVAGAKSDPARAAALLCRGFAEAALKAAGRGPDAAAALHVFSPKRWGIGVDHGLAIPA